VIKRMKEHLAELQQEISEQTQSVGRFSDLNE